MACTTNCDNTYNKCVAACPLIPSPVPECTAKCERERQRCYFANDCSPCDQMHCCTSVTDSSCGLGCEEYSPSSPNCLSTLLNYIKATSRDDELWTNDINTLKSISFYIQNSGTSLPLFIKQLFAGPNPIKDITKIRDEELKKVVDLCNFSPGTCDQVLNSYCSNMTRQTLGSLAAQSASNGIEIGNWINQLCGCHLPKKEYDIYEKSLNSGSEGGGGGPAGEDQSPQCDPACLFPGVVKTGATGSSTSNSTSNSTSFKQCEQNVCIIDDVNINISRNFGGQINFNQLCGNCAEGMCKCIFSNINVTENDINSLANVNFNLHCGNNCWIRENDGSITPLDDCSEVKAALGGGGGGGSGGSGQLDPNSFTTLYILFGVVVLIFLITLFFYFVMPQTFS